MRSLIFAILLLAFTGTGWAQTLEGVATPEAPAIKEYDGIWFAGFNINKDIFKGDKGRAVRQAFNLAVDRKYIAQEIVGDDAVPTGVIPPGMIGYDPALKGYPLDVGRAKKLMKKAGFPLTDKRLKKVVMLHTDGLKTLEIARSLKKDLQALGVKIEEVVVSYEAQEKWEAELLSGKYHMFLMGYKADDPKDAATLLKPLFFSRGEANFTGFRKDRVDLLLNKLGHINPDEVETQLKLLLEIGKIIQQEASTINLFYITRL